VRLEVDVRRAQLIALGLEAFGSQPYDAVSIDDVAQRAGISKGLLYHYFPTKRDFYIASLHEAARQLLAKTEPDASLEPLERLDACLESYLRFVEEHATTYVALLRGGVGSDTDVAEIIADTRSRFVDRLLEGVGVARPPAMLRTMLRGWVGFVEVASLDWAEHRDIRREALREMMVGVVQDALAKLIAAGAVKLR
jgi:AcrR family transcriptional regulator